MKLSPPAEDNQAMRHPVQEPVATVASARAYEGPESLELAAQNAEPVISDSSFLSKLDSWDQHLNCRRMRARLQSRCVVCGMWIADGKHIKQHYNRTHHHDFPNALGQAQQLCLSFKSQFTRRRSCRYCGSKVGAPCRHVIQCTVLHQLCLAVSLCRPAAKCQVSTDGGPRDGDLRTLHAMGQRKPGWSRPAKEPGRTSGSRPIAEDDLPTVLPSGKRHGNNSPTSRRQLRAPSYASSAR